MVGLAVLGIAGSSLLLAMHGWLRAVHSAEERLAATGMALQLLDEIAAQRYMDVGLTPYQWPLGPSPSEAAAGRQAYNDLDDYAGYSAKPPRDRWNVVLGEDDGRGGQRHPAFRLPNGQFGTWRQLVDVYYVSNSDLSQALAPGATSNYRAVRVRIVRDDVQLGTVILAEVTRVFAYVPPP
jgi:type II secretory pathway pseudopilin PulG